MNKLIFWDAETNGLFGNPFSIAAIVYERNDLDENEWIETDRIILSLPDSFVTNQWAIDNVLPTLCNVVVTNDTYESMLSDFAEFYMRHKQDAKFVSHMGYIVEAFVLREMNRLGFIGDFDGPYSDKFAAWYDVSQDLENAGYATDSVDSYFKNKGLKTKEAGATHNPLYDCMVTKEVYFHLKNFNNEQ